MVLPHQYQKNLHGIGRRDAMQLVWTTEDRDFLEAQMKLRLPEKMVKVDEDLIRIKKGK